MSSIRMFIRERLLRLWRTLKGARRGAKTLYQDAGAQTTDRDSREPTIALQPQSRLLSLPAEIRNMIYLDVLEVRSWPFHVSITPAQHELPGLLRVCAQIRHEAMPIFFKNNAFSYNVIDLKPIAPLHSSDHWSVQSYNGVGLNDSKASYAKFSGRAD